MTSRRLNSGESRVCAGVLGAADAACVGMSAAGGCLAASPVAIKEFAVGPVGARADASIGGRVGEAIGRAIG